MFPMAAFGENETEDPGQDSFVPPAGLFSSVEELRNRRIGVVTGSCFDTVATEQFPDAQLFYFNNMSDMLTALKSDKIDAYLYDEPVVIYTMSEDDWITYIPEPLISYDYAYAFPKTDSGSKLCDELSEYVRQIKSDGTQDLLQKTWFLRDEENWELPDYENLPAANGKLTMVTDATSAPFTMIYDGGITGLDINIAARFCEAYGYGLTIKNMNTDSLVPSIQSGKADFIGSALSVTPERKENVFFSEPYCVADVVLVVLKSDEAAKEEAGAETEEGGFLSGLWISFQKTFIREDRWKLFLEGLLTTLIITILSILIGTPAVIRDLAKTGKTMMIVTHEMAFARAICNRVFYMDEGGVYEDGTPEQVFDHPEKENTRRFVRRLKVLELDIPNKDYDFLGMAGLISEYCRKNQVPSKLENRTQLAFEKLVEQLLRRTMETIRIQTVMEYSEALEQMTMIVRFSGPKPEGANDSSNLSIMLLKSAISTAEYSREEGSDLPNQLVLHVRNEENNEEIHPLQ